MKNRDKIIHKKYYLHHFVISVADSTCIRELQFQRLYLMLFRVIQMEFHDCFNALAEHVDGEAFVR